MKTKRPCDCRSEDEAMKLNEQGIAHNEYSLSIKPLTVEIDNRFYGSVKIPMTIFKRFAEWYLEEQEFV